MQQPCRRPQPSNASALSSGSASFPPHPPYHHQTPLNSVDPVPVNRDEHYQHPPIKQYSRPGKNYCWE